MTARAAHHDRNFALRDVTFGVVALLCGAVTCDDAVAQRYVGAIAYSTPDGSWGYSYDYSSKPAAAAEALRQCRDAGGRDCTIRQYVTNGCGAVAVGRGGGWGSDGGYTQSQAEAAALRACRRYTTGCAIKAWMCTTH